MREKDIFMKAYTPFIIIAACVIALSLFLPVSASINEDIVTRYGLNEIYLKSTSYPGSHTVYHRTYDVMLIGVNRTYITPILDKVNPFYRFRYVDIDYSRLINRNGFFYSGKNALVVISAIDGGCPSKCGCGTIGQCCPVSIWIDKKNPKSDSYLSWLIEHELDHDNGRADESTGTDINATSKEITDRFTELSKSFGTVTITRITGVKTDSYTVYI